MRILVTGGRGFLGKALVRELVDLGHDVAVLDNGFRGRGEATADVELFDEDVRDAEAVRRAVRGRDVVAHLAAVQGTSNFYEIPHTVLDVNLRGVLNVAEACAAEGVRRLFFSSSSECYGFPAVFPTPEDEPLQVPNPLNPRWSYGGSKIAGELVVVNYARRCGYEFSIARYHNVYGPAMGWDHVIPQFIRRLELGAEFTVQGDGEQTRAFCYLDDAVAGTVEALLRKGAAEQIFNIGNPDAETTINSLIEVLSRISGKSIHPIHVPFDGAGTPRRVPDITLARAVLGFDPKVSFEEGLRRTYAWYADTLRVEAAAT